MKENKTKETKEIESKQSYSELFYEAELDLGILLHFMEEDGYKDEAKVLNEVLETIESVGRDVEGVKS